MKICIKCKQNKALSEFYNSPTAKDGKNSSCKKCIKIYQDSRKQKKKIYDIEYRKKNKEKLNKQSLKYHKKNKEKLNKQNREHYRKNKKEILSERRKKSIKQICIYCNKKFYNKRISKYCSKNCCTKYWFENNKQYAKEKYKRKYKKRKTLKQKISHNLSEQIRKSLKNNKEGKSWKKIISFSYNDLIDNIFNTEEKIKNYKNGNLALDHIIPQSLYCFESYEDEEFKKCWNLRNLRLITKEENSSKCNKLIHSLIEKYKIKDLLPKNLLF